MVMKNTIQYFVLAFLVFLMLINISAFAQEEEEQGHIFTVSTFKGVMPEGGSAAERDSLLLVGVELQKMNPKQLSVKLLRHRWGNDFQDWVFITEYASWADIEAAGNIDEENFKKKWPDKDWEEYLRAVGKYFPTHSDEIYTELPKFGK
jgi:hypothetical protein